MNVAWAVANGVTPDRFDVLRPGRFLGDPSRPYGRIDFGSGDTDYIGSGWHGPERDGDLTFRWTEQSAAFVVPLAYAAPLVLQAQLRPFEADGLPPQTFTAIVNGHSLPTATLIGGWQRWEVPTEGAIWQPGVNHVRLVFGRETRPADIGGGDGRRLAAAFDYVRIQKR